MLKAEIEKKKKFNYEKEEKKTRINQVNSSNF